MNVVKSISQFVDVIRKYQDHNRQPYDNSNYIFRGVSNQKWPLLPGILRSFEKPLKAASGVSIEISGAIFRESEKEILADFKKEAAGYLKHIPQDDDFMWMQYAQHFNVPTRLLDFTSSPLVALYFCCKSMSEVQGTVWMLNAKSFKTWSMDDSYCRNNGKSLMNEALIGSIMDGLKYSREERAARSYKERPLYFIPPYIDDRMRAQSSRFLLWGKDERPLDGMIDSSNRLASYEDGVAIRIAGDKKFLAKIVISSKHKRNILKELDFLGINEKTILPDLDGVGNYIREIYTRDPDEYRYF